MFVYVGETNLLLHVSAPPPSPLALLQAMIQDRAPPCLSSWGLKT